MNHSLKTLLGLATSMAVAWPTSVAEAQSQRNNRAGAHSHRSGHQASAVSTRPAPRRHAQPPRSGQVPPSSLGLAVPGALGSAANVRPGFYQRLNAPRNHGGHHGHAGRFPTAQGPIYVYPTYYPEVYSETYYAQPPVYSEPAPETPAAPPAIYIVTPPVIAAPPVSVAPSHASSPVPPEPRSTEPGEIRFSVLPADARVYLDDDYLGTGAELAALDEAPLFPPGVHVLEVTHPDYRPQRLVFGASDSNPAHVLIDLSIDRIGRRTRVK